MDRTSAAILRIRLSAGNACETCPTCLRAAADPARRYAGDRIVEGCIDAAHSGRLPVPSATAAFHARSSADDVRRGTLRLLRGAK